MEPWTSQSHSEKDGSRKRKTAERWVLNTVVEVCTDCYMLQANANNKLQ